MMRPLLRCTSVRDRLSMRMRSTSTCRPVKAGMKGQSTADTVTPTFENLKVAKKHKIRYVTSKRFSEQILKEMQPA
jgi:hypothetical protein